jgi:TRAP-type C4-dicarboxylate transport system substrate-binding protein
MKAKEVKRLEDIKNLKIRTPSREMSDAVKGMGAVPVPIPGLGMTEAMMRGVIDGALAPWSIALAIRQIDVATSHTEAAFSQPVLGMFMNKAAYAKLAPESKKAIDGTTGMKLAAEFGKKWEDDDTPGLNKAKSLGHPVNVLSEAESARWAKAAEPVIQAWIKEMTEKGHPGKDLVADAKALIAKHKRQMKP